jgi:hypothetical protein
MPSHSAFFANELGASGNLPVFLLLPDDVGKNAGHCEDAERSPTAGHRPHGKHEGKRCAGTGRAFF